MAFEIKDLTKAETAPTDEKTGASTEQEKAGPSGAAGGQEAGAKEGAAEEEEQFEEEKDDEEEGLRIQREDVSKALETLGTVKVSSWFSRFSLIVPVEAVATTSLRVCRRCMTFCARTESVASKLVRIISGGLSVGQTCLQVAAFGSFFPVCIGSHDFHCASGHHAIGLVSKAFSFQSLSPLHQSHQRELVRPVVQRHCSGKVARQVFPTCSLVFRGQEWIRTNSMCVSLVSLRILNDGLPVWSSFGELSLCHFQSRFGPAHEGGIMPFLCRIVTIFSKQKGFPFFLYS